MMKSNQEDDDPIKEKEQTNLKNNKKTIKVEAKKALVGAGARILFYPTLFYNVFRHKTQPHFRWWDQIDEFVFLGAVPFPKDVIELKQHGVGGVITLNEPFETLVPPSFYKLHGIEHLVIPTRDYLYAPSVDDINKAVAFIHNNASNSKATYVHCKAGRGRSTTIAICYLIKHKQMTPSSAMELIRSKRPRVLLTSMQEKAVQQYYLACTGATKDSQLTDPVLILKDELEGYKDNSDQTSSNNNMETDDPKSIKPPPLSRRIFSFATSVTNACRSTVSNLGNKQPKEGNS